MTFSAVGTIIQSQTNGTITVNPTVTGNFIILEVVTNPKTVTPTGVSGGNCTWAQLGTTLVGANSNYAASLWLGTATTTGSAAATLTYTGGTPTASDACAQQFSSTSGTMVIDGATGTLDLSDTGAGTATYPSLTPAGAGDLYFGYAAWIGSAVAGSTSGYVYQEDVPVDGLCYNVNCTSSAQAPAWAASSTAAYLGIAVLLKETGGTGATVTMGSYLAVTTAVPAPQPGSLAMAYASAYDTTAVAGTGTWTNPANAENAPDGSYATWTVT